MLISILIVKNFIGNLIENSNQNNSIAFLDSTMVNQLEIVGLTNTQGG